MSENLPCVSFNQQGLSVCLLPFHLTSGIPYGSGQPCYPHHETGFQKAKLLWLDVLPDCSDWTIEVEVSVPT